MGEITFPIAKKKPGKAILLNKFSLQIQPSSNSRIREGHSESKHSMLHAFMFLKDTIEPAGPFGTLPQESWHLQSGQAHF